MKISFFGLTRQYANLREELLDVTDQVYRSGQVLDGGQVHRFESAMARHCHRSHAIAVNSCTQGLILSLLAANPSGHQRTVIPTVSFAATLNSVLMVGNEPIFCDVDQHGLINLESLDYNPKSKSIKCLMYVNLFGNVVDFDRMRVINEFFNDSNLFVIEDAAQSFGSAFNGTPSGKLGTISVLSFDPTKNLPNYGSGGMVLTDDADLAETILNYRDNGKASGHMVAGTNSKMSESDCAQMLVKLKYFPEWQRRRTQIASYYCDRLRPHIRVTNTSSNVTHCWHKFPIWVDDHHVPAGGRPITPGRNRLKGAIEERGIETKIHYSTPLHELICNPTNSFLSPTGQFPFAETFCRTEISLPIYPELTDLEVEYIADSVIDCIASESGHLAISSYK